MKLEHIHIADSLNRAFRKQSLKRIDIELFKTELTKLFSYIDEAQDEDYHKNLIADFLKAVYYKDKFIVNVNKKQDLAIRTGNAVNDKVGIILEFKKPSQTREMISFEKPNAKAFQQLVLYYLRERIDNNNLSIKYLIATNFYEWYIFDEVWFEKNIFRNEKFVQQYREYKLSGHDTKFFYEQVAAQYIDTIETNVPCTYFNLKEYEEILKSEHFSTPQSSLNDYKLINLYKIFSPEHLLKLPFANDSNSLNKEFYDELLHILGLEEVKSGSKRTIERKQKNRNEGSLIENTIYIISARKKLKNVPQIEKFGSSDEEQLFSIALELIITWLNRILFLKLLEGQLVKYHKHNPNYQFLNNQKVKNFVELDELFFDVLAIRLNERTHSVHEKYGNLPYLNSSLFEISELENQTLRISELKDRFELPLYSSTVLKNNNLSKKTGTFNTLQYLFEFLNSYNFASDDSAEIQEENKSIISASVLGLIFEKLNGYNEGSFFTPGFITMYMCRETLRRAVVQKFNDSNLLGGQKISDFEDLKDRLDYSNKELRIKANALINSIKICDPAVGSGHFLVSALNEMIAIKSELRILSYADKTRVKGVEIVVENDELIVTSEETREQFSYHISDKQTPINELQQLQETLFNEKSTLIENCLFGVDINPKSVMICRLRLWIELLKNAYYRVETLQAGTLPELETLPNIDINIKCGNSLISRFDKQFNMFEKNILTQNIKTYKLLVNQYKQLKNYEGKDNLKLEIEKVKNNLSAIAVPIDMDYAKIKMKEREFENILRLPNSYELKAKLSDELEKQRKEYDTKIKTLYSHAFEWFIEFPEVLSDEGDYLGFDVVIGNPPYGIFNKKQNQKISFEVSDNVIDYYKQQYHFANEGMINASKLFYLLGLSLIHNNGIQAFIIPYGILTDKSSEKIRKYIFENTTILKIDAFPERDNANKRVFAEAKMSTAIILSNKQIHETKFDLGISYEKKISKERVQMSVEQIKMYDEKTLMIPLVSKAKFDILLKISKNIKVKNLASITECLTGEVDITFARKAITDNPTDSPLFKGVQIDRYVIKTNQETISQGKIQYLNEDCFRKIYSGEKFNHSKNQRIVLQGLTGVNENIRLKFSLLPANSFLANSCNYLLINNNFDVYTLLGILNSKLLNFIFKCKSTNSNVNGYEVNNLPIIDTTNKELTELVKKIFMLKEKNIYFNTSQMEQEIDRIVFNMYDLTTDEIEIVNNINSNNLTNKILQ